MRARMRELHRRVMADEQLHPAESYAWRKSAGHLPSEPRRKEKEEEEKTSSCSSASTRLSMSSVIINDMFQLFVFQL